jgi:hypothetical protein
VWLAVASRFENTPLLTCVRLDVWRIDKQRLHYSLLGRLVEWSIQYTSRWTRPLVILKKTKRLVTANRTHTWWYNMSSLTSTTAWYKRVHCVCRCGTAHGALILCKTSLWRRLPSKGRPRCPESAQTWPWTSWCLITTPRLLSNSRWEVPQHIWLLLCI